MSATPLGETSPCSAQEPPRAESAWLEASVDITRRLLAADGEQPLELIARTAREVCRAELVLISTPVPGTDRLVVEVAAGAVAARVRGLRYAIEGSLAGAVFRGGQPVLANDAVLDPANEGTRRVQEVFPIGPRMIVPLHGDREALGVLAYCRRVGAAPFRESELALASLFACHAAVALELASARAHRERAELLESRRRLAHDLQDGVIQTLYASGVTVESVAAGLEGEPAARLGRVIDALDEAIVRLRAAIHGLAGTSGAAPLGAQRRA